MKDEVNGKIISEFVGIRAKMYSILLDEDNKYKLRSKGIKRGYVEKNITH